MVALPSPPVLALLAGRVRAFPRPAAEPSAIAKFPLSGRVAITRLGLAGDEQADSLHHGGVEKAIHHYPFDHYPLWREEIGAHPLLAAPGGFGENVSTLGMTEETVRLGDRYRLGSALIEVSHGRQPCWKIAHHFDRADLTKRVVATGRAGWYYRVIEEGAAEAGDTLALVEEGLGAWPLARLFEVLISGKDAAAADLRALAANPVLAEAWRMRARQMFG